MTQSLSEEEAVNILNENITLSKKNSLCRELRLKEGKFYAKDKSTVTFNDNGMIFSNLYDLDEVKSVTTTAGVSVMELHFKVTDQVPKLLYTDIGSIDFNYAADAHLRCCPNGGLIVAVFGKSRFNNYNFCAQKDDEVLAAIMRLMPQAKISGPSKKSAGIK
jgi:hypothetical protein